MNTLQIIYLAILLADLLSIIYLLEKFQKVKKTIKEDVTKIQKIANFFDKKYDEIIKEINSKSES